MGNCKKCTCEKVCRYNDGVNLYCKENYECPHYASTVNAVEVVRCKNCKFSIDEIILKGCVHCTLIALPRGKDDFCSYGKKKIEIPKGTPFDEELH